MNCTSRGDFVGAKRRRRIGAWKIGGRFYIRFDQRRLVAEISAALDFRIFFISWGTATDIQLKNYVLYKYRERERIEEKRTRYVKCC